MRSSARDVVRKHCSYHLGHLSTKGERPSRQGCPLATTRKHCALQAEGPPAKHQTLGCLHQVDSWQGPEPPSLGCLTRSGARATDTHEATHGRLLLKAEACPNL